MATGSDFAWPSVTVKWSSTVLKGRSIVKCNWSDNLATLLEKAGSEFFNDFLFQVDLPTLNFWLGGPRNNKSIWNGLYSCSTVLFHILSLITFAANCELSSVSTTFGCSR